MHIKHNPTNTLPRPIMTHKIPVSSQWLAGEGAGSWFYIAQKDSNHFHITRYNSDGRLECEGIFKIKDHMIFKENHAYTVTYPSHCATVSIIQDGNLIQFQKRECIVIRL